MARQYWTAPVPPLLDASGTPYNTSTTLTDVSPGAGTAGAAITIPAGFLEEGMILRLTAFGTFSNTGTPTLLLGFYYGGVAGTALAATSTITTTTGATNWPFRMEWVGRVRSKGTAGSIMGQGWIDLATSLTAVTHRPIPETALATVAIDTTTQKVISVGAQWGTSNASNTLTCVHFDIDVAG